MPKARSIYGRRRPRPDKEMHKDVHDVAIGSAVVVEGQSHLPLPHEHDETHHSQTGGPHEVMRQARQDVKDGIVDTDRRGSYGLGEGEGLSEPPEQSAQASHPKTGK